MASASDKFGGSAGGFPDALYDLGNELLVGGAVEQYTAAIPANAAITMVNLTNKKGIVNSIKLAYWIGSKITVDGKVILDNTVYSNVQYGRGADLIYTPFTKHRHDFDKYLVSIPFRTSLKIELQSFRSVAADGADSAEIYIYHN